ncbi:hypothetical protein Patl1_09795 [Pistacia atlantica]|uniref:Uncharacterized protein n=1 Tax=Pistacia atlantica TaxID=434234 RepID=A0ACC1A7Z5_9ROSI|nr:hypothetical protein Patl1_09795 [Pistacia atlantica]
MVQGPGSGPVRPRARAAVRRALSRHVTARLLGKKMEPHGHPHSSTDRVRTSSLHFRPCRRPTWEITWFFVFHGMCLMAEIALKKVWADQNIMIKSRLITVLRTMLTVGFVMVTSFWWFFPTLLRCNTDVRAFEEYAAVGAFVKDVGRALTFQPS